MHDADPHVHAGRSHAATRRLAIVLASTTIFAIAEAVGGFLSNSLALLADAGHMLTDVLALALALLAVWLARRPPDPARTYGYRRAEILVALFNGVALTVIALFIFLEAWERFRDPPEVAYGLMAWIAAGGLVVNVFGAALLHGHRHGLNMRAAYLHIVGDLLGSIGALAAAGLMAAFGWLWADPVASVVIGGIIVVSSVRLVLESVNVLLEGAPAHVDSQAVRECLLQIDGVYDVHDLHLWSLCGDRPLLTAHLVRDHSHSATQILRQAADALRERFEITHVTLQIEPPDFNIVQSLITAGDHPD